MHDVVLSGSCFKGYYQQEATEEERDELRDAIDNLDSGNSLLIKNLPGKARECFHEATNTFIKFNFIGGILVANLWIVLAHLLDVGIDEDRDSVIDCILNVTRSYIIRAEEPPCKSILRAFKSVAELLLDVRYVNGKVEDSLSVNKEFLLPIDNQEHSNQQPFYEDEGLAAENGTQVQITGFIVYIRVIHRTVFVWITNGSTGLIEHANRKVIDQRDFSGVIAAPFTRVTDWVDATMRRDEYASAEADNVEKLNALARALAQSPGLRGSIPEEIYNVITTEDSSTETSSIKMRQWAVIRADMSLAEGVLKAIETISNLIFGENEKGEIWSVLRENHDGNLANVSMMYCSEL